MVSGRRGHNGGFVPLDWEEMKGRGGAPVQLELRCVEEMLGYFLETPLN